MPIYNFHERFAELVESGQKKQTMRKSDKGARRGAPAHLYTGHSTSRSRKLGQGRITDVLPVEIGRHACGEPYAYLADRNGKSNHLVHQDLDALAKEDGFASSEEMVDWFAQHYGLPFTGFLHQWDLTASESEN